MDNRVFDNRVLDNRVFDSRVYVLVSGRVQGVFFRASAKKRADELRLTGWVRNLDDGRVEAIIEGEKEKVNKMVEWCRKGPDYADVADVQVISEKYIGEFNDFSVLR
ncbi:MAG: acylphosphatase [Euryarchaeota archaeon]|nr:acylphosphatase [Euryarchaeota archaeon]MBU4339514.1 acylphosphatase [Euryarchaeota archaeon]MBU4453969.1 acylphosphatase [Euryarchaeota archaeon]MCG2736968.1 acylphosphatase [Candidatus Methanoperedenaceae archaeon]